MSTNLADYILSDLTSHIDATDDTPCKLTLTGIAEHYEVSLSPVRTAVEQLVQSGYLDILENGRLSLGNSRGNRRKQVVRKKAKPPIDHDKVIQSDVIKMSLEGKEGFLREHWATDRYGIGRTAIRPILSRLAGQGLLDRVPRRGWRIRPFDKNDLCSFIEVRELLELRALQLARPRLKKERLLELLEYNQSRKPGFKLDLYNQLHSYWIELSDNRYIQRFFERDAVYYHTLFDYAAPEAHVVKKMAAQHCAILQALLDENWADAKRALIEHIRFQKPVVKSLVKKLNAAGD